MRGTSSPSGVWVTTLKNRESMRSLSFRFITIFIVLVLVTTLIFGALFARSLYQYDIEVVETGVDRLAEMLLPKLSAQDDIEEFSKAVGMYSELGFREQIFVVKKNKIVASSSNYLSDDAEETLNPELLILSSQGGASKICTAELDGKEFRTFDKAFPITRNNQDLGILYIKYDLEDLDASSSNSMKIIVQSLAISLSFSLVLAIIIAGSITRPINKLTKMASEISVGNFDEKITIQSDDEIGKLSSMFNHMADKLSHSLDETYREKNKMEAILNNIIDGIIAVDEDGRVLHINPSAKKMLKSMSVYNTDSYRELSQFFPESLSLEALIATEDPEELTENVEAGKNIFEARCENFYDERGSKKGFILVFQDITKELKLENMRRDFIANVSHELKTPITSVKSYSETMLELDNIDRETTKYFLNVINSEADRMSTLVNDLLQLSALDAGKTNLQIQRYSVDKMIQGILNRFHMQFKKEKKHYAFLPSEQEVFAEYDYDGIERVVVNLITNALKYSEEGATVTLKTAIVEDCAEIVVEDTGMGIPKDDLDKLFTRFYRVEKSRQRKAGGSGLGLAIAKQILDLHKAKIRVESELGEGSRFVITLPLEYK